MRGSLSRFVLIFVCVFAVGVSAARADTDEREKIFNAEIFSLINGLQVVVIPNHRVPVVSHMVWYRVGSADEPRGKSGIAHFLEHLMFKGTENIPPGEFSRRVRAMGGQDNAFTSYDYTAYFQNVTRDNLLTVMEMESERMRGLTFPEDEVDSELLVVMEERRQRVDNDPRAWFGEQLRALLYVNHPYGIPVIGWMEEIEGLSRDDAVRFYDRWYAPNNAILIVSGDITAEELKPMVSRTYGTIPARNLPERNWTNVPPMIGEPRLVMRHPTIRQPRFVRMYRVPSLRQNSEDALALQVLENVMSGSAATRLYRTLVVENNIATSVSMGYSGTFVDDGGLSIGALPAEGVSLEELEAAIDEQLRLLIRDGVDAAELAEAKQRLQDAAIFARDSITGPAMIFGRMLVTGGSVDDIEYWPYLIESVTAEQVQDVARRYLNPDQRDFRPAATGYMLPGDPAAPPLVEDIAVDTLEDLSAPDNDIIEIEELEAAE